MSKDFSTCKYYANGELQCSKKEHFENDTEHFENDTEYFENNIEHFAWWNKIKEAVQKVDHVGQEAKRKAEEVARQAKQEAEQLNLRNTPTGLAVNAIKNINPADVKSAVQTGFQYTPTGLAVNAIANPNTADAQFKAAFEKLKRLYGR
jgi:hypothetical protein